MNLEDWECFGDTGVFESIIPCTTATWALYGSEDGPMLYRIVAWKVKQSYLRVKGEPNVFAELLGIDDPADVDAGDVGNFVCYLDESELATAPGRNISWLKEEVESKKRKAARDAAKALREEGEKAKL